LLSPGQVLNGALPVASLIMMSSQNTSLPKFEASDPQMNNCTFVGRVFSFVIVP